MKIEALFEPIQYVMLLVTEGCNLRCGYCKVNATTPSSPKMTSETAKRAVRLLIENSFASKISVNLHGGEPLLMPDEWIDDLIYYGKSLAKRHSKQITFPMTTNGTLLTQNRLLKLLSNGVDLSISCDGTPQINDLMRQRGNDVQRAIHLLGKTNFQMSLMMVIHQKNYNKIKQGMDWYAKQGISNIVTNFITPQGRGTEDELLSANQMLKSSEQAIEHMHKTELSVISKPLINEINWFVKGCQDKNAMSCYKAECIAGKNILAVAVNGDISLCAAIDPGEFVIGNIHNDEIGAAIYQKVFSQFHESTKAFSKCRECSIKHICTHGCTAACNKSLTYKENYCLYTHLLWDYLSKNAEKCHEIYEKFSLKSAKHHQYIHQKEVH